jgi:processing peptidase subunit beta
LTAQVFAAAGAVNHDDLVKEVEKSFQNLSTDPTSAAELVEKNPAIFTGSEVGVRHPVVGDKELERSHPTG